MNPLDIKILSAFVILVGIPFVLFLIHARLNLGRNQRVTTWLYPFYEFRDKLVRLRIEGYLHQDDYLFHYYYHTTNRLIQQKEQLHIPELLRILEKVDDNVSIKDNVERVSRLLETKDKQVREIIEKFYIDLAFFIVKNSRIVALAKDHRVYRYTLKFLAFFIGRICRNVKQRYELLILNDSYRSAAYKISFA